MKKCKGLTLMSLVIYITIMFIVLAVAFRIMVHFRKNINDASDVTFETEFSKLSTYIIEETNKKSNIITENTENSITFEDGNKFEFIDADEDGIGEIYFNQKKLCEKVNSCTFDVTENTQTGLITLTINITINGIQKEATYVSDVNVTANIINESTYVISK